MIHNHIKESKFVSQDSYLTALCTDIIVANYEYNRGSAGTSAQCDADQLISQHQCFFKTQNSANISQITLFNMQ